MVSIYVLILVISGIQICLWKIQIRVLFFQVLSRLGFETVNILGINIFRFSFLEQCDYWVDKSDGSIREGVNQGFSDSGNKKKSGKFSRSGIPGCHLYTLRLTTFIVRILMPLRGRLSREPRHSALKKCSDKLFRTPMVSIYERRLVEISFVLKYSNRRTNRSRDMYYSITCQ